MGVTASRDVIVVGGGIVGLTVSALLADGGLDVVLIDSVTPLPVRDEPYDLRTYALTPASRQILTHTGVWSRLDQSRLTTFTAMQVWDQPRGELNFDAELIGAQTPLGYMVEHSSLVAACQSVIQEKSTIAGLAGQVSSVANHADDCTVHLSDGREVVAKLVLACDGGDSPLRELSGIPCNDHDYHQHAVVANVTTSLGHGNVARQRFLREGPLALLPLPPENLSALVWTTTPAHADWLLRATDEEFCTALTTASDMRLGQITSTTRRLAFPLRRRHAAHYAAERMALVGDAAHVIHPLAGQGLNLGLLDAATIAELLLSEGRARLKHPQSVLKRYARARRGEILAMMTMTEQLNRLFALPNSAVTWLRNTGLSWVNRATPLKRMLAAHAVGQYGDVPASVRDNEG